MFGRAKAARPRFGRKLWYRRVRSFYGRNQTRLAPHACVKRHASRRVLSSRQRDLLDALRRAKAEAARDSDIRGGVLQALRAFLQQGRATARANLEAKKFKGARCAEYLSTLQDELLAALAEFVETDILYLSNPTDAEKVTMVAVGGYGRGRLAPGSDIDLLFLLPYKRTAAQRKLCRIYSLYVVGFGAESRPCDTLDP